LDTDYVSIWDDDVNPDKNWIEESIKYSKTHGDGLVGANGRTFSHINNIVRKNVKSGDGVKQIFNIEGRVDFVGHVWTLPRKFLSFYISQKVYTHSTGEDIQLAFALQKQNIYSYYLPKKYSEVKNLPSYVDKHSSWRKDQSPREYLFCDIMRDGFQTLRCKDCTNDVKVSNCLKILKDKAFSAGY
jgi:hypothetical protein